MLVHPIIGGWEPPHIAAIATVEARRNAVLPIVGLSGDLQQDLGRSALGIEIIGSLHGDEARDTFLAEIRDRFLAGEPVDFVADIVNESELEQVVIETLELRESATTADTCEYRIVLREYTEPPEPPGLGVDLGLDVDVDLDIGLDALLELDLLDLPGLLADIPDIGDLLEPVETAAKDLAQKLGDAGSLLTSFTESGLL